MLSRRSLLLVVMCTALVSCARLERLVGLGGAQGVLSCRLATSYQFRVTPLDSTADSSVALGMSSSGDVVGRRYARAGTTGALWRGPTLTARDLGDFQPNRVNANGDLASPSGVWLAGDILRKDAALRGAIGIPNETIRDLNDNGELVLDLIAAGASPKWGALRWKRAGVDTVYSTSTSGLPSRLSAEGILVWLGPGTTAVIDTRSGGVLWSKTNAEHVSVNAHGDVAYVAYPTSCAGGCSAPIARLAVRGGSIVELSTWLGGLLNTRLHMIGAGNTFGDGTTMVALDSSLASGGWRIRSVEELNDADQIAATAVRTNAPTRPIAVRLDKTSCP